MARREEWRWWRRKLFKDNPPFCHFLLFPLPVILVLGLRCMRARWTAIQAPLHNTHIRRAYDIHNMKGEDLPVSSFQWGSQSFHISVPYHGWYDHSDRKIPAFFFFLAYKRLLVWAMFSRENGNTVQQFSVVWYGEALIFRERMGLFSFNSVLVGESLPAI